MMLSTDKPNKRLLKSSKKKKIQTMKMYLRYKDKKTAKWMIGKTGIPKVKAIPVVSDHFVGSPRKAKFVFLP